MDKDIIKYILESCEEVSIICEDFFTITGISYFNFVRIYDDGARVTLYSSKDWASFILQNHSDYKFVFEEKTKYKQSSILIWDVVKGIREDSLIQLARETFRIDHGITLINRYSDFTEFCYFATTPENNQINLFYINNKNLLQQFALYFKDKASHLIKETEKKSYYLPEHPLYWLEVSPEQPDSDFQYKEFYKTFHIDRFFLNGDLKHVYLSRREAECLVYLYDGMSPKEIANELDISSRTIEGYIDQVKNKTCCNYRSDLLKKLNSCGFREIYDVIKASKKTHN